LGDADNFITNAFAWIADAFSQAFYSIWASIARFVTLLEDLFMVFAGRRDVYLGSDEVMVLPDGDIVVGDVGTSGDLPTMLITHPTVQTIFFSMMAVATVLLVFFTILKLVQNQYKERDGGNPYTTVFRMVKGMTMFLFITAGVIVGLQVSGIVLDALANASAPAGGERASLAGLVFHAKSSGANRLTSEGPNSFEHFHENRIRQILNLNSVDGYHIRVVDSRDGSHMNVSNIGRQVYIRLPERIGGDRVGYDLFERRHVRFERTRPVQRTREVHVHFESRFLEVVIGDVTHIHWFWQAVDSTPTSDSTVRSAWEYNVNLDVGDQMFMNNMHGEFFAANRSGQHATGRYLTGDEILRGSIPTYFTRGAEDSFPNMPRDEYYITPLRNAAASLLNTRNVLTDTASDPAGMIGSTTAWGDRYWHEDTTPMRRDQFISVTPGENPSSPPGSPSALGQVDYVVHTFTYDLYDNQRIDMLVPWLTNSIFHMHNFVEWLQVPNWMNIDSPLFNDIVSQYRNNRQSYSVLAIEAAPTLVEHVLGVPSVSSAPDTSAVQIGEIAGWINEQMISRSPRYRVYLVNANGTVIFGGVNRPLSYRYASVVTQFFYIGSLNHFIGYLGLFILVGVLLNFVFGLIQRVAELAVLYMMSPITIALYPFDDGNAFSNLFVRPFYRKTIAIFAPIISLNLFFVMIPVFQSIQFFPEGNVVSNAMANAIVIIALFAMLPAIRTQVNTMFGADNINEKGIRQTFQESMKATVGSVNQNAANKIGNAGWESVKKGAQKASKFRDRVSARRDVKNQLKSGGLDRYLDKEGHKKNDNGEWLDKDGKTVLSGARLAEVKKAANMRNDEEIKEFKREGGVLGGAMFGYGTEFEKKTRRFRQGINKLGQEQRKEEYRGEWQKEREAANKTRLDAIGETYKTAERVFENKQKEDLASEEIRKLKEKKEEIMPKGAHWDKMSKEEQDKYLETSGKGKEIADLDNRIEEVEKTKNKHRDQKLEEMNMLGWNDAQMESGYAKFEVAKGKGRIEALEADAENVTFDFLKRAKVDNIEQLDVDQRARLQNEIDTKQKETKEKMKGTTEDALAFDKWFKANTNAAELYRKDQLPKFSERTFSDESLGYAFEVAKEMRRALDHANSRVVQGIFQDKGWHDLTTRLGDSVEAMRVMTQYFQADDNKKKEMEAQYNFGDGIKNLTKSATLQADAIKFTSTFGTLLGDGASGIMRGASTEAGRNQAREMTKMMLDEMQIKSANISKDIQANQEQAEYRKAIDATNDASTAQMAAANAMKELREKHQMTFKDLDDFMAKQKEIIKAIGKEGFLNAQLEMRGLTKEVMDAAVRGANSYDDKAMDDIGDIINKFINANQEMITEIGPAAQHLRAVRDSVSTYETAYINATRFSSDIDDLNQVIQRLTAKYAFEKGFIHGKPLDEYRG